jgi:hypothetical protein
VQIKKQVVERRIPAKILETFVLIETWFPPRVRLQAASQDLNRPVGIAARCSVRVRRFARSAGAGKPV